MNAKAPNRCPLEHFYVFELQEDGRTWLPAPNLHGGYVTARDALWRIMDSQPDEISRIFKVARSADARAVHVYRRPVWR
jgi:hypothetical protein